MQSDAAQPSNAAEPSALPTAGATAPAPAAAAAAVTLHSTMGPDEHILQELDLVRARPCLTRVRHPYSEAC